LRKNKHYDTVYKTLVMLDIKSIKILYLNDELPPTEDSEKFEDEDDGIEEKFFKTKHSSISSVYDEKGGPQYAGTTRINFGGKKY